MKRSLPPRWSFVVLAAALAACAGVFAPDPLVSADPDGSAPSPADGAPLDAELPRPDAAPRSDGGTDGSVVIPARCDPDALFRAPVLVREISTTANETAATLSADELTIHFARDGVILSATRPSTLVPFATVTPLPGLGGAAEDDNPSLSADGRSFFFSSKGRGTGGRSAIFRAPVVDGGVGAPSLLPGLALPVEDPAPTSDGGGLFYSASRGAATADDLYFATSLTAPVEAQVPASDPAEGDGQPVLSPDERSLYFGSRRSGLGGSDVFVSRRASTAAAFTTATWLGPPLNSTTTDLPLWISADGCVLYLTSDRSGGAGGRDIYRSERGP